MSKYNPDSIYGTLFVMLDNFSDSDTEYLMDNVFTGDFLDDVKNNPSGAYKVLDKVVKDIEDGKGGKVTELLAKYKDKLYMLKAMLKDYGNLGEKKAIREETIEFVTADLWAELKDLSDDERLDYLRQELGDDFTDDEIADFLDKYRDELNESRSRKRKIQEDMNMRLEGSDLSFVVMNVLKNKKNPYSATMDIKKNDFFEGIDDLKDNLRWYAEDINGYYDIEMVRGTTDTLLISFYGLGDEDYILDSEIEVWCGLRETAVEAIGEFLMN